MLAKPGEDIVKWKIPNGNIILWKFSKEIRIVYLFCDYKSPRAAGEERVLTAEGVSRTAKI